ncbi:methyltransferase type 12 [Dactylonectria macrodidyma]|uniref:Methyltransferase type 12 n=1 Tax=Dactylonectria macrodidyma TaxID=307937 RepID=A0A9P9FU66_9HYPO|nr:methyltransferase type 12 [Dactylonectria macrodidyma]
MSAADDALPAPVGLDASLSHHLPPIEPDSTDSESDIRCQNDECCNNNDTLSPTSSSISTGIRDYSFENARHYHKFREGRCMSRPLYHPLSILDLGTGTGSWASDMIDEYPDAEIVGIDLRPIQPAWVPPKVKFLVDDAEAPWLNPPRPVDFPALLAQSYEVLTPGAWIEIQDFRWEFGCDDGAMPPDYGPAVMTANPRNRDLKTIGLYTRGVIFDGLQATALGPLTRGLQWTPKAVEDFLVNFRKDSMKTSVHSHVFFYRLYAQKPLDERPER